MNVVRVAMLVIMLLTAVISSIAHPLGNFSLNQYSGIIAGSKEIKVSQILDMAEIPTLQASAKIDLDGDGKYSEGELAAYQRSISAEYLAGLHLSANGSLLELTLLNSSAGSSVGEGGLPILQFKWDLSAELPEGSSGARVRFENSNFTDRVGWNEVAVDRDQGVTVYDSTAFSGSVSNELRNYPADLIMSPLAERSADFSINTAAVPPGSVPLRSRSGAVAQPVKRDRLVELMSVSEVTPAIAIFALLIAFGLGAVHALSPGHGKAIVGAYLVGSRGTPRHALLLGLTVTFTHTLGVFALGLATLFASEYFLPEQLMRLLSFFSGLIVLFIGLAMFKRRFLGLWDQSHVAHSHSEMDDAGVTTHTHGGSTHTHQPPADLSFKNLIGLGISGGMLPCPTALVLMLSAINLGRIGFGIVLTTAFSFGLASTLTAVGLLFLFGGKLIGSERFADNRVLKAIPVVSALVIACLGAVICYTSI
ncbi:MAG: hypothetical protein ABI539_07200 [Acidobacteriota bacterium]